MMLDTIKGWIPDVLLIKLQYYKHFGKRLNLKDPKTFNEKLNWSKLYDRNPLYTQMADKCGMKKYVADKVGKEFVIPVLGVWEHFDEIDFGKLKFPFVLKTTHDSGGVVICKNESSFDKSAVREKLENSLKRDFFLCNREWCYKDVPRRIIAEEYVVDDKDGELRDYKVFCFNGQPKFMFVATGRASGDTRFDFFDMEYNSLNVIQHYPAADVIPHKPDQFDLMKKLAAELSQGIPQVRVDFFVANGKVYVGEFTFYHFGGVVPFEPSEWDLKFGEWFELPER